MNPRIENLLQISADTSEDIRQQVPDMDAGFDDSDRTWEIIVKTAGSLDRIRGIYTNAEFTQLLCGYWIVRTTIDNIEALATEPEIILLKSLRHYILNCMQLSQKPVLMLQKQKKPSMEA